MEKTRRYKVVVSDRARQMLGVHVRFLSGVSPLGARKAKGELLKAIRSLAEMPERHSFFSGEFVPPNQYHKMIVGGYYLILYQIRGDTVFVDYILDCRADYQWLIR